MTGPSRCFDVLVVGAGAAGLSAAATLSAQGKSVCLLEARDRVGGRILSVQPPGIPIPLELGAEFIHGESACVFDQLRIANDVAVDVPQTRLILRDGRLQSADVLFDAVKRRLKRLAPPRVDLSFVDYLERHRRVLPVAVRSFATMLVEGFDAADPSCASAIEILKEWAGDSAADAPTFRPQRGYGALIASLISSLDPQSVNLQLRCIVSEIRWQRGRVVISATRHGQPVEFRAAQAIVTLPLGVLQLSTQSRGGVRFMPALSRKDAPLLRLAAGAVVKMVLCFNRSFWAELDMARYRDAAFFLAPDAPFPTFWTTLPARTPILVAWSGGPQALRLAGRTGDELTTLALASLASIFGRSLNYRGLLESVYWHDWQRDPFSGGAYSYPMVGGNGARQLLARSVAQTLFFAGEATDADESAEVGGALNSGRRAAQQLLRSRYRD